MLLYFGGGGGGGGGAERHYKCEAGQGAANGNASERQPGSLIKCQRVCDRYDGCILIDYVQGSCKWLYGIIWHDGHSMPFWIDQFVLSKTPVPPSLYQKAIAVPTPLLRVKVNGLQELKT